MAAGRGWPATSGAALGAVAACRFPYAFVAAVPVLLALRARRPWDAARVVAGAVAAGGVLVAITWASTGQSSPYTGERYWFSGAVPFETQADVSGLPFSRDGLVGDWQPPRLADVAGGLFDFVTGRYAGILLYFPTRPTAPIVRPRSASRPTAARSAHTCSRCPDHDRRSAAALSKRSRSKSSRPSPSPSVGPSIESWNANRRPLRCTVGFDAYQPPR
jgi:hypothetical protein